MDVEEKERPSLKSEKIRQEQMRNKNEPMKMESGNKQLENDTEKLSAKKLENKLLVETNETHMMLRQLLKK